MSAAATWVRQSLGTYFGNATAVRDYRVQLRGNRAVILWAVYLAVLIGFGMLTYSAAAGRDQMSVVEAQASLKNFYTQVLGLLATIIVLVAPALTATAIVAERQRKSLDLVFSAPVTPKYYLAGKMISSYRYLWMLLVLSLPVTAACVVLGGATWSEVLTSYALMSLHGLIYTSIALLFSTLALKPVGAIVWSYIGVFVYLVITSYIGELLVIPRSFGFGGGNIDEMPFVVSLSPVSMIQASSSYTVISGHHVPNWLLAAAFTFLFVRLMILAGSSALSSYGSWETKSLRLHSLVYTFLLSLGLAVGLASAYGASARAGMYGSLGGSTRATPDFDLVTGRVFIALLTNLVVVLPFLTCFGKDLERKFWPDGAFKIRRMLLGTPSGGLPYLLAVSLAAAAGFVVYGIWEPSLMGLHFLAFAYYGLALVFAAWSVGRYTSALANGLRYARTLHFTVLVLVMWLPVPLLLIADPFGMGSQDSSVWDYYVLRPLFSSSDKTGHALVMGTILIAVGLGLSIRAESLAKTRYRRAGLSYE